LGFTPNLHATLHPTSTHIPTLRRGDGSERKRKRVKMKKQVSEEGEWKEYVGEGKR
jgi:hypothetical protein